jgi:hypothetical protein
VELDYSVEINDFKEVFDIDNEEKNINISEKIENSITDKTVKVFDLRLWIFWKKLQILFKSESTTKKILIDEIFEFIATIISLLNRNGLSKFCTLILILMTLFHFEDLLDKYEQIDYKSPISIKQILPLYQSKSQIVESLLKTCYPHYPPIPSSTSSISSLLHPPSTSSLTSACSHKPLISSTDLSSLLILTATSFPGLKDGLTSILTFSGSCPALLQLYEKTLQQLIGMYGVMGQGAGYSGQVVGLKLLRLSGIWEEAKVEEVEWAGKEWNEIGWEVAVGMLKKRGCIRDLVEVVVGKWRIVGEVDVEGWMEGLDWVVDKIQSERDDRKEIDADKENWKNEELKTTNEPKEETSKNEEESKNIDVLVETKEEFKTQEPYEDSKIYTNQKILSESSPTTIPSNPDFLNIQIQFLTLTLNSLVPLNLTSLNLIPKDSSAIVPTCSLPIILSSLTPTPIDFFSSSQYKPAKIKEVRVEFEHKGVRFTVAHRLKVSAKLGAKLLK